MFFQYRSGLLGNMLYRPLAMGKTYTGAEAQQCCMA